MLVCVGPREVAAGVVHKAKTDTLRPFGHAAPCEALREACEHMVDSEEVCHLERSELLLDVPAV